MKHPSIRFKNCSGEWKLQKLGSLCEKFSDGDWIESKDQSDEGIRLIQTGNVGIARFIEKQNNKKWISEETFRSLNCDEVYPGDVLISRLPEPAGRACIVPDLGVRMITAVDCTIVRPRDYVDSKFLIQLLASNGYQNEINTQLAGGTRQRISRTALSDFDVFIPEDIQEQIKIGGLLEQLDSLIDLQDKKCVTLKNLMKSMLERLYPSNDDEVPVLRLKEDTKSWSRIPLRSVADKVIEKNDDIEVIETFTNSAELGIISQRDYFDHDISNVDNIGSYYIVRDNDFVYNPRISSLAPVGPINRNKLGRSGIMSPLYMIFRTHDIDNTFLEYYFKSYHWHSFMYYNGDSGARSDRFSIKDSLFFEMPIPVPGIDVQKKIGQCLRNLDCVIDQNNNKLNKYKNIKASFLEGMFV